MHRLFRGSSLTNDSYVILVGCVPSSLKVESLKATALECSLLVLLVFSQVRSSLSCKIYENNIIYAEIALCFDSSMILRGREYVYLLFFCPASW